MRVNFTVIQGSYWSLEKRESDLLGLPVEWAKTVAAFISFAPETFSRPSVINLSARLQAAAENLAKGLRPGDSGSELGLTLMHGDFKTANLFISGRLQKGLGNRVENGFAWCCCAHHLKSRI